MIYLFDGKEKLVKIVNRKAVKTANQTYTLTTENYVSDRLTVEMKALNDDEFEQVEYMAIQSMENNHQYHYFYIAQKKTVGDISTFTGVQSGIEELRKTPVFDKRPNNMQAEAVINDLLKNTNWRARFVAETINRSANFYYISVFDALKKICKVWGLEMQFFVEMNGNGIGARYIDFKKRIGEATGKRVVYGHNALEILKEIERTNVYTALVGRGKGEQVSSAENSGKTADGYGRKITFENVTWSKAQGDPLDKPKGQKYLEHPEMTRRYGIKNADGSMRAKIGFVDFNEEEDPNELIKLTYQALVNASRPQLTLKTSSVYLKGVKIGDTIRVVRHDKKLDYDTRVFEITFNRLNNQSSDIKLGDRIGENSSSKVKAVADKAVEEFINNGFNSFIENLPDFIKTADGYNTNWYSVEDPVKKYPKKVLINDIWYKPDPEHEGHTIMQRWTGEVWEEILRTYNEVSLREKIDRELNELRQSTDEAMARTRAIADMALHQSGTDSIELVSKRVVKKVLDGDLFSSSLKKAVTKTFEESDNGSTIYGKISSEIEKKFITIDATDSRFRQMSEQVSQTNKALTSVRTDLGQARTDINNTKTYIRDANNRIDQTNTKVAEITRQIEVQVQNYNAVRESTKLYERILGTTEEGAPDKLSRLVMSSEIFQTEVGKYVTDDNNLIVNSMTMETNTRVDANRNGVEVTLNNGVFSIKAQGLTGYNWTGFTLPIYVKKIYRGETYTLGFKYRIRQKVDTNFVFVIKNHRLNKGLLSADIANANTPASDNWIEFQRTFTVGEDFAFGEEANYPFYIYIGKNGWVEFKEPILVRGSNTGPYKPSQFDDAYKSVEATRTQVTQLAGSWSVRNINSAGDVLNSINLLANGTNRIDGRLTHITGQTIIDNAVIKDGMIANVSADKLTAGTIDANDVNIINLNAKSVTSGTFKGIDIKGSVFSSLDNSFYIDTNKKEFYLNDQTLFTFFNRDQKMYSFLGTGNRLGNGDGGGLMIGVDCDDREMYKMHGPGNGRDLWTASSYTSTTLALSANKAKKAGTIMAKAPTGIELAVKPNGTAYSNTYLLIGNIVGEYFENKILAKANKISLLGDEEIYLRSSKKVTISGGAGSSLVTGAITGTNGDFQSLSTGSLLINRKDLVAYFNALADFVVRIAEHAGWTVKSTYRI